MRLKLAITLFALVGASTAAKAQTDDERAVRAHIEALFDAMRASDSVAVREHFHPETSSLYSVSRGRQGELRVHTFGIDELAASVGQAPVGVLDEQIGEIEVRIDGDLATAWLPYAFYIGEDLSHCGFNSFHLVRTEEGWRTIHITDTRRHDCYKWTAPE